MENNTKSNLRPENELNQKVIPHVFESYKNARYGEELCEMRKKQKIKIFKSYVIIP